MGTIRTVFAAAAFALATAVSVLAFRPAAADSVTLLDGRVIEGQVVDKGENYEVIVPNGTYTISKASVSKVVMGQAPAPPNKAEPQEVKANPGAAPAVSPPPPVDAAPKPAAQAPPKRTPDEEADDLLLQAQDAIQRKSYPIARTALEMILKMHPNAPAASRARTLLMKEVPTDRGHLILGLDEASELEGSGAELITDPKIVPVGKGAAHIPNLRGRHARFRIESRDFSMLKTVSFWVWNAAYHGGLESGTTYFCFYTDNPKDFESASFQMRGDGEWHLIEIDYGRFKEWTHNKGRRFTAVGFWNPSKAEVRDFLVDDIRFIDEDPQKAGPALVAPTEGKPLPSLQPPRR